MLRTLLVPAILVGIIATPLLMPSGKQPRISSAPQLPVSRSQPNGYAYPQPVQASSSLQKSPFRQASQQRVVQTQPSQAQPGFNNAVPTNQGSSNSGSTTAGSNHRTVTPGLVPAPAQQAGYQPSTVYSQPLIVGQPVVAGQSAGDWGGPIYDENNNIIGMVPGNGLSGVDPATLGMTPDFGAAQTMTFGGSATGPDFAAPMQFTPVMNFGEIFNYNVTPAWVGQRWDRVSNVPAADGLRGKRVALVTGTNSWDLHGSLTYYFDEYQTCRRITFRGWAGDPSRLIELLQTNHGLKQQPTHWAGFYLAKSWRKSISAMLMKSPTVTYIDNKAQQMGVLLELNDPKSKHQLSQDFISLIRGSKQTQ